jgi:integrase
MEGHRPRHPVRRAKRLPVPHELVDWIDQHVPREGRLTGRPLFVPPWRGLGKSKNEKPTMSETSTRREWARACDAAGVEHATLRGDEALARNRAARQGVSERVLQTILGHRDPRSTRQYAQLGDDAVVVALCGAGGSNVAPSGIGGAE